MNQRASAPIGILDEHPDWSDRLVAELTRRRLPWERIDHSNHAFDPRDHSPAYSVVVNRTSPSSHTRAHAGVLFYAEPLLTHYESLGVPVVNPVAAYRFEKSKALQLGLFERLGVRYPRAVVVNHRDQVRKALDRVRFPLVVKPNVGGSGAGIVRFAAREELEIESMMRTVAGVGQIHDLHVWTLTSGKYAMSGDVVVVAAPGDRILPELHALLHERFDIDHTTIQLESEPLVQIAARKSPSVFSSSPQRTVDHGEQQQKRGPLMHWPGREATRSPGVASARRPWLVLMLILTILVPSQAMAEPRLIDLPVRERLLPRDQRIIRVQQGDDVTLRWTTNHELTVYAAVPALGSSRLAAIGTLGLLTFPAIFLAIYLGFAHWMASAGGRPAAAAAITRAFVLSLVPIAIGYHLAHYFTYLLIQGQLIIPLVSDP